VLKLKYDLPRKRREQLCRLVPDVYRQEVSGYARHYLGLEFQITEDAVSVIEELSVRREVGEEHLET